MKLKIDPTVVYRIPKFSYQSKLEDCWEELKASISQSSPDFYEQVKHVAVNGAQDLDERMRFTIWKYFNRARFRATPYGSFAGIGICHGGYDPNNKIIISNEQVLHRFHDWKETEGRHFPFEELLDRNICIVTNSSYYIIGGMVRYVDRIEGKYELAEQPIDETMQAILLACQYPVAINELILQFIGGIGERTIQDLLKQMVEDQLLLTALQPNLIGQDYFYRLGLDIPTGQKQYIISERQLAEGKLDLNQLRHLPSLVEKLHDLLPSYTSTDLEQFVNRFIKKFGEREVPVMEALDPELGIGYGNMESAGESDPLIEQLLKNKKMPVSASDKPDTISVLFGNLIGKHCTAIDLETIEHAKGTKNEPLPNSLPVLVNVAGEQVYLEHIGGCTTNMLLGRFTLASDAIYEHCRCIARWEQDANPDVLFFDIAYAAGGVVDNVNRRKSIYDLQLSILNYYSSCRSLALNDLYLSVRGNKLMLCSKVLYKRLVPRIASAYNYQLSDLPLFRLLCDLQHQDTHKNLYMKLRDRLPGLAYYPRLYFRNIVLSPQTWKVDVSEAGNNIVQLGDTIRSKGITDFVKTGNADQTLCFDLTNSQDLHFLLMQLRKHGTVYLEEMERPRAGIITDRSDNPYISQFIINLIHDKPILSGLVPISFSDQKPQLLPPGADWLYFEIYCHYHRSDELLMEIIAPFIEEHRLHIIRWFFIRYTENGHHIRLRLKLHHPEYGYSLTSKLTAALDQLLSEGLVSDMQIKTYRREAERYGLANLPTIENLFCMDSEYVLMLLRGEIASLEKYRRCINIFLAIGRSGVLNEEDFQVLIERQLRSFSNEHDLQPPQFKILNASLKGLLQMDEPILSAELSYVLSCLQHHWIMALRLYAYEHRASIFTALFHMHINRLFTTDQRLHEAIIYYFLQKIYTRSNKTKEILKKN